MLKSSSISGQCIPTPSSKRIQKNKQGQVTNCVKKQKRPVAMSLLQIEEQHSDRNSAIVTAYKTGAYSQREIGEYFRLPLVLWVSLLEKPRVLNSGPDPRFSGVIQH